jgi:hypothetical protein
LKISGFNYLDVEPAPVLLPAFEHGRFGYGIYSARYGNVYTARQLLQLFDRAFGDFRPIEDIWESDGRAYDPFRPNIEPDGFASAEEMRAVRESHFAATRQLFQTTDIFVFTLGLTEGWLSSLDGAVFQVCPGTTAGRFDANKHQFRNFSFQEIYTDLQRFIGRCRAVNRSMRFILTVSPVPLTATASGDHVLSATMYSKAVLRSVAGALVENDPLVDYFPSYEIITSPTAHGVFYEQNLRSVTPAGVNQVMKCFFEQHRPKKAATSLPEIPSETDPDDIICEDAELERYSSC